MEHALQVAERRQLVIPGPKLIRRLYRQQRAVSEVVVCTCLSLSGPDLKIQRETSSDCTKHQAMLNKSLHVQCQAENWDRG